MGNLKKKYAQGFLPEKLPQQDHTTTTDSEMEEPYLQGMSHSCGTPVFWARQKGRPHTSPFLCLWRNLKQGPSEHFTSTCSASVPVEQGQKE